MPDPGVRHQPLLMVLDDERAVGETICRMTESEGVRPVFVCDPRRFMTEVRRFSPDLVVLDLMMPGMDGVEIIRQLAEHARTPRIIITSGVGHRVLDAAGRSARAHGLDIIGVLPKPFTAPMLRGLIKRALARTGRRAPITGPEHHGRCSAEDLAAALDRKQITVAYQPKVHCRTGSLVGFEVLARWMHPEEGVIEPDLFIALAEKHGLIDRLTLAVSEQALHWLAALVAEPGLPRQARHILGRASISINISGLSLGSRALFERIAQRCADRGIAPQRVVLELTESAAMRDTVTALDNLTRLRLQGFHLSIDDFGTGYSSMAQLMHLPFSEIKIDRRFVSNVLHSEDSRAMVHSMVELGRNLGLGTIAEGVEDEAVLEVLRNLGCDYVQGYWIARPLAPGAVLPWFLTRERAREERRVAALVASGVLHADASTSRFYRLTRLVRRVFGVDAALLSFCDHERQWFKACAGIGLPAAAARDAFCDRLLSQDALLVIEDAGVGAQLGVDVPALDGRELRFYAGHPVFLADGSQAGTLTMIDHCPRSFSAADGQRLAAFARAIERELLAEGDDEPEPMTGLPSRRVFHAQAVALLALCRDIDVPAVFVSVRLIDLAMLNRRAGREMGDVLIRRLAEIVTTEAAMADLVGRRSGTEFTLMLIDPRPEVVAELCRRLQTAVETGNVIHAAAEPPLYCKIATARLESGVMTAAVSLDEVLRAQRQTFAAVTGD